jgi:hypothetical protein
MVTDELGRDKKRKMQSFGHHMGNVYVVIGAKGGTGAEIVKRLLERPAAEVWRVSPHSMPLPSPYRPPDSE